MLLGILSFSSSFLLLFLFIYLLFKIKTIKFENYMRVYSRGKNRYIIWKINFQSEFVKQFQNFSLYIICPSGIPYLCDVSSLCPHCSVKKKKKKSKWTENGVNWTQVGCAAEDENLIAFLRNRERRKGYKTIFKHEMTFKNLSHYDASQLFVSLNRTRWTVESHRMENVRWVHALFTSIRHDRRNKSTSCSDRHL